MKQVLEERDDIVFYLKMLPLSIHPEAYKKAVAIVCEESNEKAIALLEDAYEKKPLPEPSCESNVVKENIKLSKDLGFSGLPTIVLQNGKVISRALKAEELVKVVGESAKDLAK